MFAPDTFVEGVSVRVRAVEDDLESFIYLLCPGKYKTGKPGVLSEILPALIPPR